MCVKIIPFFFALFPVFLGICFQVCYADTMVTVYAATGHSGDGRIVNISQCVNLPETWRRVVSSISTHGICGALFDGVDCTGSYIEVMPTSPAHYNLEPWDFDNMAVSLGPCKDRCSVQVAGILPDATFQIELYSETKSKGLGQSIDVNGCMPVPYLFLNKTFSVNTHGHCLQLYNNNECNEHLGRNVEMRRNTPYHDDLGQWGMSKAKSLSHCGHKCSVSRQSVKTLQQGDVVLFDERNLQGNYLQISAQNPICYNISSDWAAKAESIQMGNGSCITLYNDTGCVGESLFLKKSDWDLRQSKFADQARSMKSCGGIYKEQASAQANSDSGTSPFLVFMIVVLVLIAVVGITVMWFPNVKRNASEYYGTLKRRIFEQDGEEIYSGGFHWGRMPKSNEQEAIITNAGSGVEEGYPPSQPEGDYDFPGQLVNIGEVVYEELVYKNTVEPNVLAKKQGVRV